MILQLPNGRIIELSVEQYLDMTDQDIQDLNSLGIAYTKDCVNPFYNLYSSKNIEIALEDISQEEEEVFLSEDDIDLLSNRVDPYYFPEDEGDFL
jgi:hypothetical protein